MKKIPSSEITPQSVYLSRRSFFKRAGLLVGAAALAGCTAPAATDPAGGSPAATGQADELGDKLTDYRDVITYNNFYEFSLDKEVVSRMAQGWVTSPWSVSVGGLVNRPRSMMLMTSAVCMMKRNASTGCAAWKAGQWSSPGWDSP